MHKAIQKISKNKLPVVAGIALLILAVLATFLFWLYSSPIANNKIKIFKKLNLPVAKVDSGYIGGKELFDRYEIASQLYSKDQNFQSSKAQTDILDRLVEVKKLEQVALKRQVSISKEEADAEYDRLAEQEGGKEKFEKTLSEQYHFNAEQFKEKALVPDLLKTKLAINFYSDRALNPELYKTLTTVTDKLDAKVSFAEVAKTYSEDSATKQFGGDNGEIPIKDLAPELQIALKKAEPEQTITAVTRFGIYIIKVLSIKEETVSGGSIHFQSIYLNYGKVDSKVTESAYTKWYKDQILNIEVKKFINL